MKEELKILMEMKRQAKRMRKMYEGCNKTYCHGDEVIQQSYEISRKSEWQKMQALTLAIRHILKNH